MRKFECFDCNQSWAIAFGKSGQGVEQNCPYCGSRNVCRIDKKPGRRGRTWELNLENKEE